MNIILEFFTFFMVFCATCSIWISKSDIIKCGLIAFTILVAFILGNIIFLGVLASTLYIVSCYIYYKYEGVGKYLYCVSAATILFFGLALKMHYVAGFENIKVVDGEQLSSDSLPYSLWFNLDTAIISLSILAMGFNSIKHVKTLFASFAKILPAAVFCIIALSVISVVIGLTRLDFKVPNFLLAWVFANLFITVLSEEALFRFFLQSHIQKLCRNFKYSGFVVLIIPAIFATLIHAFYGVGYYTLVFLAQLFYGYVYYKTNRIEISAIVHFMVNIIHLLMFSYPALYP